MNSNRDGDPGLDWYAIHTRHRHEKTVAHILSNKGCETFLPLYSVQRRWSDRTKEIALPLFPCYVFLRGGIKRLDILMTPGVHSLVEVAGVPAAIPELEIEAVRQVVERCGKVEPCPFLKCGDWVRVKSGPLEGLEGILVLKKNRFKLVLSVDFVDKSYSVEVDVSMVEPAARRGSSNARSGLQVQAVIH